MSVNRIDSNGNGSGAGMDALVGLEKFQAIRDLAKKKMDGTDNRFRLEDLLKQKHADLGLDSVKKPDVPFTKPVGKINSRHNVAGNSAAAKGLQALMNYGKAGSSEKPDPKPKLGRYVDFMA